MSWGVFELSDKRTGKVLEIHVAPLDRGENQTTHKLSSDCFCGPDPIQGCRFGCPGWSHYLEN